ncbi:CPCC family cysteine-rich protein [Bradyrhizobium sp. HKCCYLS2038]|uniref:CPCC family cysteine-rich protein n=1 Tax=unclassified Bradyrhizobium TaxID=2631580 RepID=UPI003EBB5FD3
MPFDDPDKFHNVGTPPSDAGYRCPCCRFLTLGERGGFEICAVCYWEDDGQDDHDADVVRGGPNGALSLTDARRNFAACGASDPVFRANVRMPRDDEL